MEVPDELQNQKQSSDAKEGTVETSAAREWISVGEMQELLGIGSTKSYALVASGEIPAVKIGRVIRINRRALLQWLEEQSYTTAHK